MSEYQDYVDSLILNALRSDDEKALTHLFQYYYNRLFRSGLRWCGDANLTEECIQEVFFDLWRYRQNLGEIQSLESYLKVVLRRRIFKKLKRIDPILHGTSLDETMASFLLKTPSVLTVEAYEEVLIQQQTDEAQRQRLLAALQSLTVKQKEIIHLKYFEDMSYIDIADKMDMKMGAVYKLLHEAVKKLKAILLN
jgi:RNA polymerase sigma-70 factor (ECF subfamily)